jgi:hypothetical protein
LLRACHRLLREGGRLWIETPNLDSLGHSIYGENWRGLEPPRHLVLFNRSLLGRALSEIGFRDIRDERYRPVCEMIFAASAVIGAHRDLRSASRVSMNFRRMLRFAEREEAKVPHIREFVTFCATK